MRKLISTDCHVAPPYELTNELPEQYREYFPHVVHDADGDHVVNPMRIGRGMMAANGALSRRPLEDDLTDRARTANGGVPESAPSYEPAGLLAELEREQCLGAVLIGRVAFRDDVPTDAEHRVLPARQRLTWRRPGSRTSTGSPRGSCCRSATSPRA